MQDFSLRSKWRGFRFFYDGIFYGLVIRVIIVFFRNVLYNIDITDYYI